MKSSKKNSYRLVLIVILFISFDLISILLPHKEAEAISVDPYRTEITISAGENYKGEFTIINNNNESIKTVIFPDKSIGADKENTDSSKWLKVSAKELIILSKQHKKITYKVNVPKNAKGEYAPTIVFREEPLNGKTQAYVQIRMPIYIFIKGTEIFKGEIEAVKILACAPILVSILLRNNGNVHVRPIGTLTIKKIEKLLNETTKEIRTNESIAATLEINKKGGPVFGGGLGDIGGKFETNLSPGTYSAELKLEFSAGIVLNKKVNFEVNDKNEVKMLE